jgi:hypothetical protein
MSPLGNHQLGKTGSEQGSISHVSSVIEGNRNVIGKNLVVSVWLEGYRICVDRS